MTVTASTDELTAGNVIFSYGSTNVTWATLADVPPDSRLAQGDAVQLYGLEPGTTVRTVVGAPGHEYVYTNRRIPTPTPSAG